MAGNIHGDMAARSTEFSLWLAKHILSGENKRNMVVSPLSIHVVLSLLASGCNVPTRDQLLAFLRSISIHELDSLSSQALNLVFTDDRPRGGPHLSMANRVWLDNRLTPNPAFTDTAQSTYRAAAINQVDFLNEEARKEVIKWFAKQTKWLITEVLPRIDPLVTRFVLGNATCFKGEWAEDTFDPSMTKHGEFFLSDGTPVQVPFMSSCKKNQRIAAFDGFKVLNLPYRQGRRLRRFSMCIFLPDSRDGLPGLLDRMGSEPGFLDHHIPYKRVKTGHVRIPKFKIESSTFDACEVVREQGVDRLFRPGGLTKMVRGSSSAPLPKRTLFRSCFHVGTTSDGEEEEYDDCRDLYVDTNEQKAFIQVDEQGTQASSIFRLVGASKKVIPIHFVAHHPFIFLIREHVTGAPLFIGQLLHPNPLPAPAA